MKVQLTGGPLIDLGTTEAKPTIGIIDYSRRTTDEFGVTTVVKRGFSRRMSLRFAMPFESVDSLQSELVELRTQAATWIADPDFQWLTMEGFYREFDVDLAVPPTSYCRLTVEGITETEDVPDPGGDPAPNGQASTLKVIHPTDGSPLVSSNVPEADYPEWASGTSYGAGARVIKASTHRIYESSAAVNLGNDPATAYDKWIDLGPTNRWAMFDQALGTASEAASPIVVQLPAARAVGLLDVVATTVRVQATGYDQTKSAATGIVTFLDLPAGTGTVTVTISGSGTVSVGTLIAGSIALLGVTEASPSAGIVDFSRKTVDDFGEVTIVDRAWSKKMATKALISTASLDLVANRIANVRGRPVLWIAEDGINALTVYGFFKDFEIEVGDIVSILSLSIEGLSKAAPVAPWGAISAQLTNESATVSTFADGTGGYYLNAGGTFKLFAGTTDITLGNGVVYSVADQTVGLGVSIDPQTGVYTIANPTPATGSATLRATYNGKTYDKVYSFAKALTGANGLNGTNGTNGADGRVVELRANDLTFDYMDGVPFDNSQVITLTAHKQNTSEALTWSTTPNVTLAGTGDVRTLSLANFGGNTSVTVTVTGNVTGATSSITLIRNSQVSPNDSIIPDSEWGATAVTEGGGRYPDDGSSTYEWRFGITKAAAWKANGEFYVGWAPIL